MSEEASMEVVTKAEELKECEQEPPVNGNEMECNDIKETDMDCDNIPKEEEKAEESKEKEVVEEKKETKDDEDDDEDDEESEEELPPGLLERPIEILKDKRERKKVTRFSYDDVPTPDGDKKKRVEIPEGPGVKLSEHPRVEWQLQRNKVEDLKIIHKLFFGTFGDMYSCKKNMRLFSGFPFDKDSQEYEKKEDYVGRFTLDNLKWTLTVCDLEKKGKKEDLIDRLLLWCLCPKPSDKPLPQKKKKKETKKKRRSKSQKSDTSRNSTSMTSDDLSSDEDEPKSSTPKKRKTPSKAKSSEKKTEKRKSGGGGSNSPKKIAKIRIGSPKKSSIDDSDDSDAPLAKKKSPPTNTQIQKTVEKILKGADLEVITMKAVCMKVYSRFPDFDLSDRKAFIKETVKKIIS